MKTIQERLDEIDRQLEAVTAILDYLIKAVKQ